MTNELTANRCDRTLLSGARRSGGTGQAFSPGITGGCTMWRPILVGCFIVARAAHADPLVTAAPTLSEAGASRVLHEAESRAVAAAAPSAIAVVDGSGMLLAFVRMDGTRPGSIELAIGKARSAALMRRPTSELEDNVAKGRTALATEGLTTLRGGAPIIIRGGCVGAVGVAGSDKDHDAAIAAEVAAAIAHAS